MDGTYFYLYVNTDCDSTTTIFKSVPKEMVQQMEALLDRMPEITRKWNLAEATYANDYVLHPFRVH